MEDTVVVPEEFSLNSSAPWDLEYSAQELTRIADRYPKWTSLPSEECERLRSSNASLWLLLNYHSNVTTGLPVRCLDHAPQPHLSNTVHAIILSIMFVVSLVGNVMTVYSLTRRHKSTSRQFSSSMYSLIFHLSIADLLVTFTCLLGEAAWSYSVSWLADNFTCKLFKFAQVFSLYLSTFVLVLIGLDRFLAVKYPMKTLNTKRRCSRSVICVWILSLVFSSPQFLIFRVGKGPFYEDFYQCVTYGFYTEAWQEQLYTISSLFLMFILPLIIIIWSYVSTFIALAQSENAFRAEVESGKLFPPDLNRRRRMSKAKTKSMRISVVIVVAFIICWTPYYFMMIVFMFHEPDEQLANDLRNGIFCFGMSNSLINPIIYGTFHLWKPRHGGKLNYSSKEFYMSGKSASLRQKNMSTRNGIKCQSPPLEGIREDKSSLISLEEHKRSEKTQSVVDRKSRMHRNNLLRRLRLSDDRRPGKKFNFAQVNRKDVSGQDAAEGDDASTCDLVRLERRQDLISSALGVRHLSSIFPDDERPGRTPSRQRHEGNEEEEEQKQAVPFEEE